MPLNIDATKKEMLRHTVFEEWMRRCKGNESHRALWNEAHGIKRRGRPPKPEKTEEEEEEQDG